MTFKTKIMMSATTRCICCRGEMPDDDDGVSICDGCKCDDSNCCVNRNDLDAQYHALVET